MDTAVLLMLLLATGVDCTSIQHTASVATGQTPAAGYDDR